MNRSTFLRLALAAGATAPLGLRSLVTAAETTAARPRKLVLIAGKPSHPPGIHEFRAGTILLEKRLAEVPGLIIDRHESGWVTDEATFTDADAVVCFSDGNASHPLLQGDGRLATMEKLVTRGVSFGCMHFGVEVPKDIAGDKFRDWMGGCYENAFSCNPIWTPEFSDFPEHPITRGLQPFAIRDEWYFNMRFTEGFDATGTKEIDGVKFTPILIGTPPDATRDGPYVHPSGPYPHIVAAKGRPEVLLWAVERPDGGRGLGFTGGHFHRNWMDENFRKLILNALCWVSGVEVPAAGVDSAPVSEEEIALNLDDKR